MVDREKVIYSIERCICHVPDACRDCAYDAGHPYNECVETLLKDALSLLKAEEAKPLRCGGCSWFTQTQESGVGYCSFPNCEREVFDTEYCSWGAWTGKEG